MVRKSLVHIGYKGTAEHWERSKSVCKMGPCNKAFLLAIRALGRKKDRNIMQVHGDKLGGIGMSGNCYCCYYFYFYFSFGFFVPFIEHVQ